MVRASRLYSLLLNLHLVGGLVAGLFLLILSITGSALAFSDDIDRLLHPSLFKVVPYGQPLPLSQLAKSAATALHPEDFIQIFVPSARPDTSYSFTVFTRHRLPSQVFVDQYSGRVLGRLSVVRFRGVVQGLHTIPAVMGCASVILMFLVPSGLYLWWPLKRVKINLSGSVRRLSFDLHNSIGFFSSLFLFVFAATGAYMAFEPWTVPASYATTHSNPPDRNVVSTPQSGVNPISLDHAAAVAQNSLPDAAIKWIGFPRQPSDVYFARMRFPEDRSDNGSSEVWIDQFSGKPLRVVSSRAAPLGSKIKNLNRTVHTGAVFGVGGKALAAWLSLMLSLQSATGVHMWWSKRRAAALPAGWRRGTQN